MHMKGCRHATHYFQNIEAEVEEVEKGLKQ